MTLLQTKSVAGICLLLIAAACGTEGGNPHRKEPDADKEANNTDGGKENGKNGGGNTPAKSVAAPTQDGALTPVCDISFALSSSSGSPQFSFIFDVPESTTTRSSTGAPLLANATLTRDVTNPAGEGTQKQTKPISDWQPASGNWGLGVQLIDPSGTDQDKVYCSGTLTLGIDITSSTNVTITVRGLKNPQQ